MKRTILAVFLLVAAASGCGTLPNGTGPDRLSDSDVRGDKAIILVSTGLAEPCGAGADVTHLWLFHEGADYSILGIVAALPVHNHYVRSDFADHPGFLHAVALTPGNYYLAPAAERLATSHVVDGVRYFSPGLRATQVPKFDLTVAAGEVVYLGEFWWPDACSATGTQTFRDQQTRDMDVLTQKNPKLDQTKIVKRLPVPSGFAVGGDQEAGAPK